MRNKLLHIFKQNGFGLVVLKNASDLKKHGSSRVGETFHFANNGKRLTRESRQQHIVLGNAILINFCNIAKWNFTKIVGIRDLGGFIPL